MVSLQDIEASYVALFRRAEEEAAVAERPSLPPSGGDALPEEEAAVAERPSKAAVAAKANAESTLTALSWATHLRDHALLVGLAGSLPEAVLEEQVRLYEARDVVVVDAAAVAAKRFLVHPHLLRSRMQAAAAFDAFLRATEWLEGARKPRHAIPQFVDNEVTWAAGANVKDKCRSIRRWHATWLGDARLQTKHIGKGC